MNSICIIDIEASGLDVDAYPIEVAVLFEGKSHSWLIKPEPSWDYWCPVAESMHGITREQLEDEGESAALVANALNELLKDSDALLYSDAMYWDTDWIDTLYHSVKIQRQFHVGSLFDLLNTEQTERFSRIRSQLAMSGKYRQHRADEDVRMIFEAYSKASREQ